jgi:hypothetical protein
MAGQRGQWVVIETAVPQLLPHPGGGSRGTGGPGHNEIKGDGPTMVHWSKDFFLLSGLEVDYLGRSKCSCSNILLIQVGQLGVEVPMNSYK